MAIINQRWPRDLPPETCVFGRSRNDVRQVSPATRASSILRFGRPLWSAQCTWNLPNDARLARLRYWLEALDGYAGSVQIWDFNCPAPQGLAASASAVQAARLTFVSGTTPFYWSNGSNSYPWLDVRIGDNEAAGAFPVVVALAPTNQNFFIVSGLPASTAVVYQGQYAQVGRRLYVADRAVTTDAGGVATIYLTGGLLAAAAVGDPIRLVEAACEMELVSQDFSQSAQAGAGYASISATFIETVTNK